MRDDDARIDGMTLDRKRPGALVSVMLVRSRIG